MTGPALKTRHNEPIPRAAVPVLSVQEFRDVVIRATDDGARIASLFGYRQEDNSIRMIAVLTHDADGSLSLLATNVDESYPALTPDCPQAHWFEREIAEQWGIEPRKHPWLKPIRFHRSYRPGQDAWGRKETDPLPPSVTSFFQVEGEEIHEVAVGPVHAGIIEPGHFRFQCHGENVQHLEISLGYQHRGIERALVNGPDPRTIHYMETAAGDTTVGHALAHAHLVEALNGMPVAPRAHAIRAVALELERLANHTGDLGALAGDVGFLPTASYCGRLRGDFLNMTALLCGNRFGRSLVEPGGIHMSLDARRATELRSRLIRTMDDVTAAAELLFKTPSVMARFEETGVLSRDNCRELGLVGPAARACGLMRDVRMDFPSGMYCFAHVPVCTWHTGDVFARAFVRWLEIQRSAAFIDAQLRTLPDESAPSSGSETARPLQPDSVIVSLVEGWRGEICHAALTDAEGRFVRYKLVDPSFHNWMGLALTLRGQQISDFPLCNKSFNLSYCGHDL